MNAYLLLANGMVFAGQSVGAQGVTVGEVGCSARSACRLFISGA